MSENWVKVLYEEEGLKVYKQRLEVGKKRSWHYHDDVSDVFYVVKGTLDLGLKNPDKVVRLEQENIYQVTRGRPHEVVNAGAEEVEWLLVQGIGKINYQKLAEA